eukprot:284965-Prorocentrum_minimum.AAC.3
MSKSLPRFASSPSGSIGLTYRRTPRLTHAGAAPTQANTLKPFFLPRLKNKTDARALCALRSARVSEVRFSCAGAGGARAHLLDGGDGALDVRQQVRVGLALGRQGAHHLVQARVQRVGRGGGGGAVRRLAAQPHLPTPRSNGDTNKTRVISRSAPTETAYICKYVRVTLNKNILNEYDASGSVSDTQHSNVSGQY